ncbi:MAG: hypothetical protein ACI358_01410 [Candidatus Limimorpha sp.]
MATLDEILGGSPTDGGGHVPRGSQQLAEQNSGKNATVPSSHTTAPTSEADAPASGGGGGGYEELFKKLNPYSPPTKEDLEKERKRQKRAQIFAAIGDGVAALSNLYFASQYAPNMFNGQKTITGANKVRYDKLLKDREEKNTAYFNGLMRARQADAENAHLERSWQRQLGLDQEAIDRYKEGINYRNERQRIDDERYTSDKEYRRGRDEEDDRRWQANFDENKRHAERNYNFQVKQHNDNVAVRREQASAIRAKVVRGNKLGFADGKGNQVAIYENVWKGSMQQVYDAMLTDLAPTDEAERKHWERQMEKLDTPQKKEDYVKQNWHRSQKAKDIMNVLSKIDPADMTSELSEENGGLGWGNQNNNIENQTDW